MKFSMVTCPKGHYYDSSINSTCPECAKENGGMNGNGFFDFSDVRPEDFTGNNASTADSYGATESLAGGIGATEPAPGGMGGYPGATEPVPGGMGGYAGATEPVPGGMGNDYGATEPIGGMGNKPAGNRSGNRVQDYGATQPVYMNSYGQSAEGTQPLFQNDAHGFLPVVGWLVSVEGPTKGTDYRIRPNMNFIGSDNSNDIVIKGDNSISRIKAAILGYDPIGRMFLFGPSNGRNFVYVNGKATVAQVELQPRDIIQIGRTKLLFVPLCDENFNWE